MAITRIFFSDLKSGKSSGFVETRLLRWWEARNVKRGGELMWVDMLLIDVNSTVMQATINAHRLPKFRERLIAGKMFSLSGFDVCRSAQNFRVSDAALQIRFTDSTDFDEITEPVSPLPEEGFRFRNQSELVGLANTNSHLPDIIGEITSVKSTVGDDHGEKKRVMATIKLDCGTAVVLSLFDAQAVSFHKKLDGSNVDPKVIVATSINPKMVGGGLFLNATSGTHIYFDKETNAGESLFYKLVTRDIGLPSAAPLLKGYAKVETLTISELNAFVASSPSQDIDFICTGKVVGIDLEKGWCYVACSKCSKKLQRTASSLECARCINSNAVGVLRYRVELAISDATAEGAFVCFDGVMTKLHNLRAAEASQMLAEEGANPEDAQMPPFITDMGGKTFTFQVRVNTYNFTAHHQTFTITRILSEHERVPVPDFVNDGDNDGDDTDLPGGTSLAEQVETGSTSGSGVKNDMDEKSGGAQQPNTRGSTKAAKRARLA